MSKIEKTTFIVHLLDDTKEHIRKNLESKGLSKEEIRDAMASRLCDIEDTIDIHSYLDK